MMQKLTSRKLWMAIAGVVTGIALALGADGAEISTVAGAVTVLISTVTYIIVEGKVDAESVKNTIVALQGAADTIQDGSQDAVKVLGFGGDDHGAD